MNGIIRPYSRLFGFAQRLADAGIVVGVLVVACHLYPTSEWGRAYLIAALFAAICFNTVGEANSLYRSWRGSPLREEMLQVLLSWAMVIPTLLFAAFFSKTSADYSRITILGWFVSTPFVLVLWRLFVRLALREVRRAGGNSRSVAIVGVTPVGIRLAEKLTGDAALGIRLAGFYDDRDSERPDQLDPKNHKVGDLKQLAADARAGRLDIVYLALPLRAEHRINEVVRALADTTATVYVAADLLMFDLMHGRWGTVADIPVVSVFDSPFDGVSGWVKRVEDVVLSIAILALIALPMLVIAAAIKLTSPGPVFFVQRRYGLGGKAIKVLKFRTMRVVEDGTQVKQATKDDPRITRLGAFLRKHSLDELPQFINVLSGSMSVVGPRPHAIAHNELYRSQIHGYMLRHKVKPGITGWAQVNGWRGETDTVDKMQHRIEHDLYYINNWSLLWDIKIVWLTVFGTRVRENAY